MTTDALAAPFNAAPTPFNADLAHRVLEAIEANPHHWNQRKWCTTTECGTAMCFAGWACHLEGWQLDPLTSYAVRHAPDGALLEAEPIPAVALRLLGLEDHVVLADMLFGATNDLKRLRMLVGVYAAAASLDGVNADELYEDD